MYPHGIQILDTADHHGVVRLIPHHLQFVFLPSQQGLFDQNLAHRAGFQAAAGDIEEVVGVIGDAPSAAPQGEGRANDEGIAADLPGHGLGFQKVGGNTGGANLDPDAPHGLLEQLPVFRLADCLQTGANQLHAVAFQHATFRKVDCQIERCLSPHGGQQGVRALRCNHLGHHIRDEGLNVGAVRHFRIGHDGGRVGIHQHHLKAFVPQGFTGLGSGVVELAGLTDDNRPGTQQENAL